MADPKTDSTTIVTYFLAGIGAAYILSRILDDRPACSNLRPVRQAVGPEETWEGEEVGGDDFEEEFQGVDEMHPANLQQVEPSILQPTLSSVGPQRHGLGGGSLALGQSAKLGGSRIRQPQRIYSTSNVPGADIGQYKMPKAKFTRPKAASKAEAPKASPANNSPPATTPALVKQMFPPEIDSRDGMVVMPR